MRNHRALLLQASHTDNKDELFHILEGVIDVYGFSAACGAGPGTDPAGFFRNWVGSGEA